MKSFTVYVDGREIEFNSLFDTSEDYQKFQERFSVEVKPELDEQRLRRARSELDAMKHLVD